ncbi:MAG: hypothetical protein ACP5KN_13755, partial [Armatimonadota bacterium]
MSRCPLICCIALTAATVLLSPPGPADAAVALFNDLGDDDDTDPESGLFIPAESGRWQSFACCENPDRPDGLELFGNAHHGREGWISFRIVLGDLYGDFHAHAEEFDLTDDGRNAADLHLAVRYKDTVLSPTRDAYYGTERFPHEGSSAGVYAFTGRDNAELLGYPYVRLGELGARNDKVWRTGVYQVPAGTLQQTQEGLFRFSLGFPEAWGRSSLYGDLRVDWIRLSDAPIQAAAPRQGFWPAAEPSRFADLPSTGFSADDEPFFPIILDVNDGASSAREDSFALWKETGFNVIGYYENAHGAYGGGGRTYWGYREPFVEG